MQASYAKGPLQPVSGGLFHKFYYMGKMKGIMYTYFIADDGNKNQVGHPPAD